MLLAWPSFEKISVTSKCLKCPNFIFVTLLFNSASNRTCPCYIYLSNKIIKIGTSALKLYVIPAQAYPFHDLDASQSG